MADATALNKRPPPARTDTLAGAGWSDMRPSSVKSNFRTSLPGCARWLRALLSLALFYPPVAGAQAPPPPAYQDLYTELDNYLVNFNGTLGAGAGGSAYSGLLTGSLKASNSNAGPGLIAGQAGMLLQLQALKAMGARAIMVQVGFPVLWEPFLASQGQSYASFAAYYQAVAAAVRQAGLKLIVENDTLLSNDVQAGWPTAPFYATLNWTQYQQARAQMALTVAQLMQPDYMVVVEEPTTEESNSGQTEVDTPTGSASMLSQILASVAQSGVPGLKVGAGVLTTQPNAMSFIGQYLTLPVDFIDIHVYAVNRKYLPIALQIASAAAAAGKPVAMTECWLTKVRDSELGVLPLATMRARDPFSFWAPLDSYFIQTMQNLASYTKMLFMDPYGAEYYFAYQTYDSTTSGLTPAQILSQEGSLVSQANRQALYTTTGLSYYHSAVAPPDATPPTAPSGLTGASASPTSAFLRWQASTDNVGVAGYYVFRNGQQVGQTAALYYQDTGLTDATTYTYAVQAFDLAGNLSAMTAPVTTRTTGAAGPTAPANVLAAAVSCYKTTVTWSPSTDSLGVSQYLVFAGTSPSSLAQVGVTSGSITSYADSALSPAVTYYFAVQAEDKNNNLSPMSAVAAVTTPALPSPPAGLRASPKSETSIALAWSASSGGLPVAYYLVYRGASPAGLSQLASVTATAYSDTTVTAATTYYYAVQAVDSGLPPAESALSPAVAAGSYAAPSAPAGLAATPGSCTRIALAWAPAAGGGLPIASYHIYRGPSPSNLSQVAVVTQTAYTDATLSAATTYYYAVASADTLGELSPLSPALRTATPAPPSAPAGLTATPISTTSIGLSWAAASAGGLPVRTYRVFRGASPASLAQAVVVTQTSYTDASRSPSTTYYYAVQAGDTAGDLSPMSAVVSAATPALPSPPANLAAVAINTSQVGLSWTDGASGMPIAGFQIFRGNSPSAMAPLRQAVATKTSATDYPVTPATTYYYAIEQLDTGGNYSPMSNIVAVTTPAN